MSESEPASSTGAREGIEQIADPDDYNTRRRLRQLHDARERVKEMKNNVLDQEANNPRRTDQSLARRNVAETVVDYILELRPILAQPELQREEEFLAEEIETVDGEPITFQDLTKRNWFDDGNVPSLRTSMRAWDLCNDYLEEIAGAMFEENSLPSDGSFDATDEQRGW